MLEGFLRRQEIGVAFLQEVKHPHLNAINRYIAYTNEGTTSRGTAILARERIILTNVTRLPSGRGIAAKYQRISLVNIYAPSGAARRKEREIFYNGELTYLLPTSPSEMILPGDFNCALAQTDCTGQLNCSRVLDDIFRRFNLTDVWEATPPRRIYTHYTPTGASRLDTIYITKNLNMQRKGVETLAGAFTDHLAVVLRLSLDVPFERRGRDYWIMNVSFLGESTFRTTCGCSGESSNENLTF